MRKGSYLEPILLGKLLLREIFTLNIGAGALLVLLGVFWASR